MGFATFGMVMVVTGNSSASSSTGNLPVMVLTHTLRRKQTLHTGTERIGLLLRVVDPYGSMSLPRQGDEPYMVAKLS